MTVSLASLPLAKNAIEQGYEDLIKKLYGELNRLYMENNAARNYIQDYYAMWVHQIKVPISAMKMLLQDQSKSSPLNVQLFNIEQYVEMALSYVRLGIRLYRLRDKAVRPGRHRQQAVRKYAPLFIAGKISLDIEDTGFTVNTDEKWLCFVIGSYFQLPQVHQDRKDLHIQRSPGHTGDAGSVSASRRKTSRG